ncbi:hypothetical protein [Rhizobium sp. LjRoot254]|uniref:hypothetical protein n=1 Tax=Rhizobium sp. LjRoot254 TaxID=3342297 RepID=UPI003ECD025E
MRHVFVTMFALLVGALAAVQARPTEFGVAGVPKYIGESRDYEAIFAQLQAAGVDIFFPVFQYQEAPAAATLGFEVDFVPPCQHDSAVFVALRRHKIRLIVPGGLLYSPTGTLPAPENDPLRALIGCAGRAGIYGVLSFDEPALNGINVKASRRLYERVKLVDPSLPVLMVQSPMVIEPGRQDSAEAREAYMSEVRRQSEFADVVGFSIYPIPPLIAKLGSPGHDDQIVDHQEAVEGYMGWLDANLPGKPTMAVLQSFAYSDQFERDYLTQVAPPDVIAAARSPNRDELQTMAQMSIDRGANLVIWYGAAFISDVDSVLWRDILAVSKQMTR